ncbi:hypothetical protein CORC01_04279 [Colletotrichum orchidophilum]|uniref:Short-chain dehydrogenase n=1 Tax=Colletotrichum orchidophilum TaxID=1209926 RepID=A0A1G4BGM1_9PEZI|nr:uncharacterized protein CORC01_04279 [Colletotrichum orchidophilum]OHF00529.1 hypothetical protein CORC01_04279 [Colletotrichum orchidophilum]
MAIILVTGANRGIGFGIVQAITGRVPNSTVLIGCRTHESGEEAVCKWRDTGVKVVLDVLPFDIEDDASIAAAAAIVEERYGKLDVLINNAARVTVPESLDFPEVRSATNAVLANCVTSNLIVTQAFVPLLRKSDYPRVIMTSSARGSMTRTANGELPPAASINYCMAKAALNMLTLQLHLAEERRTSGGKIVFWATSPGHCKTAFNGFRGTKEPVDGAEVFVRLLESERGAIASGTFCEVEDGEFNVVPW